MRILLTLAVAMTFLSAFTLYAVNYETRGLAEEVKLREKAISAARRDIAILKTERAHLSRPERIARHARKLGLAPAKRNQFDAVPGSGMPGSVMSVRSGEEE